MIFYYWPTFDCSFENHVPRVLCTTRCRAPPAFGLTCPRPCGQLPTVWLHWIDSRVIDGANHLPPRNLHWVEAIDRLSPRMHFWTSSIYFVCFLFHTWYRYISLSIPDILHWDICTCRCCNTMSHFVPIASSLVFYHCFYLSNFYRTLVSSIIASTRHVQFLEAENKLILPILYELLTLFFFSISLSLLRPRARRAQHHHGITTSQQYQH